MAITQAMCTSFKVGLLKGSYNFTNTTGAGTEWNGNDCSDWTSTSGTGAYGSTSATTEGIWSASGSGGACNVLHRYYCFQMGGASND